MIQNSKEPLGFVTPRNIMWGYTKMSTFNAIECRHSNDYGKKSTLWGPTRYDTIGGFPKNILGFSKKRKDKL